MIHKEIILPNPALRNYVSGYYIHNVPYKQEVEYIPPNLGSGFAFLEGRAWVRKNGKKHTLPPMYIIPVNETTFGITSEKSSLFGVKFHPGKFFDFFGWPQHLFVDRSIDLADTDLGKEFSFVQENLAETEAYSEKVKILDNFLLSHLPEKPFFRPVMDLVLGHVFKTPALPEIEAFLKRIRLSRRHLRRLFKEQTGTNLRTFSQIVRFYNAFFILSSGRFSSLTEVGHKAGYYDQAHFIRDFTGFTGMTPRGFINKHPQLVEHLAWDGVKPY